MYLIVNLGLKSIRIIVFDAEGNQLHSISRPVQSFIFNDQVEQDASEWLVLLDELLTELKRKHVFITFCKIRNSYHEFFMYSWCGERF